jgi:hypothetical protein
MDIPQDIKDAVHDAIGRLAGVCDHAQSRDTVGFSASTASVGHELAALPRHYWLPAIYVLGAATATHHRGQLERFGALPGEMLDKISALAGNLAADRHEVPSDWATFRGEDDMVVLSLGSPERKWTRLLKRIPGAFQPAGGGRVWCVPGDYAFALASVLEPMRCEPGVRERVELSLSGASADQQLAFLERVITASGENFTIHSPYDEAVVATVKTAPGAAWYNKTWNLPATAASTEVVERLVTSHGFAMTSDAAALARRSADMVPPSDIEVNDTGAAVILAFKYNPSWVEAVKALPRESRRFDSITKTWAVERDPDTLTALVENLSACAKVPDEKSMQALEDLRAELAPAPAGP